MIEQNVLIDNRIAVGINRSGIVSEVKDGIHVGSVERGEDEKGQPGCECKPVVRVESSLRHPSH